jgi:protein-S-isoprenylcysteine O-methyltransferase Ste14
MRTRIPPPVLALVAAVLMVTLDRTLPLARLLTGEVRWLGAAAAAAAIAINLTAFLQFRRASTTVNPLRPEKASALVTTGVFAYSRNPMYLGMLLLLGGLALGLGSLSPWLGLPLFFVAVTWLQILPEERALERNFGDDFRRYRNRTGRWFGRSGGAL